jgi:hypothetical protein
MRGKSHRLLGQYLVRQYMPDAPKRYVRAFLIGCIEPDRNPMTYLKGSVRCQWLRGHNYENARRFMCRLANRLENKETLSMMDYYALGKLIHYTTDAFTYAHNQNFPEDLKEHREYEKALQEYFIRFMQKNPLPYPKGSEDAADTIQEKHRRYMCRPGSILRDSRYAFTVCCLVTAAIL